MKTVLQEMFTLAEVDEFIDYLDDGEELDKGLRKKAETGSVTAEERHADENLDMICKALERRRELQAEIDSGWRSPDVDLNVHV